MSNIILLFIKIINEKIVKPLIHFFFFAIVLMALAQFAPIPSHRSTPGELKHSKLIMYRFFTASLSKHQKRNLKVDAIKEIWREKQRFVKETLAKSW